MVIGFSRTNRKAEHFKLENDSAACIRISEPPKCIYIAHSKADTCRLNIPRVAWTLKNTTQKTKNDKQLRARESVRESNYCSKNYMVQSYNTHIKDSLHVDCLPVLWAKDQ